MYTAYVLDDASRSKLTERFPPLYSNFVGHHVTVQFDVPQNTKAPPQAELRVIGYVDSGDGLEAFIVTVNSEKYRGD